MTTVHIEEVDERDNNWEQYYPRFRIYLQSGSTSTLEGGQREWTGGATATYDVTGADFLQVLDWAQRQAAAQRMSFAIALVSDDKPHEGRGLVWLVGRDGNDNYDFDDEADGVRSQQRMLARRTEAIRLPDFDQMPPEVANLDRVF